MIAYHGYSHSAETLFEAMAATGTFQLILSAKSILGVMAANFESGRWPSVALSGSTRPSGDIGAF
jgi:hypothetical protein